MRSGNLYYLPALPDQVESIFFQNKTWTLLHHVHSTNCKIHPDRSRSAGWLLCCWGPKAPFVLSNWPPFWFCFAHRKISCYWMHSSKIVQLSDCHPQFNHWRYKQATPPPPPPPPPPWMTHITICHIRKRFWCGYLNRAGKGIRTENGCNHKSCNRQKMEWGICFSVTKKPPETRATQLT